MFILINIFSIPSPWSIKNKKEGGKIKKKAGKKEQKKFTKILGV